MGIVAHNHKAHQRVMEPRLAKNSELTTLTRRAGPRTRGHQGCERSRRQSGENLRRRRDGSPENLFIGPATTTTAGATTTNDAATTTTAAIPATARVTATSMILWRVQVRAALAGEFLHCMTPLHNDGV